MTNPNLDPINGKSTRKKKSIVGASERTPMKHDLLNRIVGREVGMMRRACPAFLKLPYVILDLCAGDGIDAIQSGTCSPEILSRHASHLGDVDCHRILIERDPNTYDQLLLSPYAAASEILNIDAREYRFPNSYDIKRTPAFIHNDANKMSDWALTEELFLSCPQFTTTLSTLGCNVGGLKRLSLEEREQWFNLVDNLLMLLPHSHDACLVYLDRDESQWAYLITGPKKWHQKYNEDVAGAFRRWPKGYQSAWVSEGRLFDAMVQHLFLTKEEMQ